MAVCAANQWLAADTPKVPLISGRVVNMSIPSRGGSGVQFRSAATLIRSQAQRPAWQHMTAQKVRSMDQYRHSGVKLKG